MPALENIAANSQTQWQSLTIPNWYGQRNREVEIVSDAAVWYHSGKPAVPIRWVLIRDPQGSFQTQALLSTDPTLDPRQILIWFVRRWRMEVTFHEVRTHLGVETQRQWSDLAIARTTPVLLGLFSLVALAALRCHEAGLLSPERTAWYAKEEPTFSDCLRLIRARIWQVRISGASAGEADVIQLPRGVFEAVVHGLAAAA